MTGHSEFYYDDLHKEKRERTGDINACCTDQDYRLLQKMIYCLSGW